MSKAGDQFGRWVLQDRLGRGGNGEVWRAVGDDAEVAIKVLTRPGQDRRARFADEVAFLLSDGERAGVIPILHADLEHQPPYYVMPVAEPLRIALRDGPDPSAVIDAIAIVSATLARLADEGIGHRDIKPDNLLALDGEVVVADFGLVTYPDKRSLTKQGRRVGPLDYMAPEMRADADRAEAEPADVYALAKTLWVLLTDRELPLPGPHRVGDATTSLATYLRHPHVAELDVLLEAATRHDPDVRPTMREFAAELDLIRVPAVEEQPAPATDELLRRLSSLATAVVEAHQRNKEPHRRADEVLDRLSPYLLDLHLNQLQKIEGVKAEYGHGYGFHTLLAPHRPIPGATYSGGLASVLRLPSLPPPGEIFLAAVGIELAPPDTCRVVAGLGVIDEGRCVPIWVDQATARLGSAALAADVSRLGRGLGEHLPEALAELARRQTVWGNGPVS